MTGSSLENDVVKRNYRIIEAPHHLLLIAQIFAEPDLRECLTFSSLYVAMKG